MPVSPAEHTRGLLPTAEDGSRHASDGFTAGANDLILITGANGFIGLRLVENLLRRGFCNLRCFVRRPSQRQVLEALLARGEFGSARLEVVTGNLLSSDDCVEATRNAAVVFHLAAGRGEKSFPDAFMNSVVTTRNLLEACLLHKCLRRFVNVSSFTVYANGQKKSTVLDESCPVEDRPERRGEAYCFGKVKQDELVSEYGEKFGIPYVIVRPGYVYGPGKTAITGRVGIDTFGVFLHLGGSNQIPLTYVDNCADAIALAGLKKGIDGEIFNIVDDELPSSRDFLRLYKRNVKEFPSWYVPHAMSFGLCYLWEKYSQWSADQLPPVFNRKRWHANWQKTRYSNEKLKARTGWAPQVPMAEGLGRYFEGCRLAEHD
ncbi:MAG TPA: NAD(P)-dependent oxidoreductase [Terriglobales bacterium]|nr:NAD(P)-dependent oxidoreductase [Terriglobales bacterium]